MAELRSLHLGARAAATLGDQGTDRGLSGDLGLKTVNLVAMGPYRLFLDGCRRLLSVDPR